MSKPAFNKRTQHRNQISVDISELYSLLPPYQVHIGQRSVMKILRTIMERRNRGRQNVFFQEFAKGALLQTAESRENRVYVGVLTDQDLRCLTPNKLMQ